MKDRIKNVIAEVLFISKLEDIPDDETPRQLGADSMDIVEISVWLEDEFGIKIEDEEIVELLDKSIEELAAFAEKKGAE